MHELPQWKKIDQLCGIPWKKISTWSGCGGFGLSQNNELYVWGRDPNGRLAMAKDETENEKFFSVQKHPFFQGKKVTDVSSSPSHTLYLVEMD
jgi:hypothetical protein